MKKEKIGYKKIKSIEINFYFLYNEENEKRKKVYKWPILN